MSVWATVLLGTALCFAAKLAGHLVPAEQLEHPRMTAVTAMLPVALLAALVAVQTLVGPGGGLVVDARLAAVGVATVALLLRAPFVVVVALAAVVAALLRQL